MRARYIILLVVIALLVAGLYPVTAGAEPGDAPPALRLRTAEFTPALGERPAVPPGLGARPGPADRAAEYIVQFEGPIEAGWAADLDAIGAQRIDYLPDFAYRVLMTPRQAAQAGRLDHVSWVGRFEPAFKLSPDLSGEAGLYAVAARRGVAASQISGRVTATGAQVLDDRGGSLTVWADPDQIAEMVHAADVAWIEPFRFQETLNEYGAGAISGTAAANNAGYDGSSQIVAVADTGFGRGRPGDNHRDVENIRVVSMQNWFGSDSFFCYDVQDDGGVDVSSGHGTHVAGSVLGSGGPSGEGRGAAPGADLVFQAVENYVDFYLLCEGVYPDGYYLIGIPSDLNTLFAAAHDRGARIHSNSWGSAAAGDYTADAAEVDTYIWNTPEMSVVFAAGNEGIDANGDGLVDPQSISSPATAKNAISVGASENDRNGDYPCDAAVYVDCTGQNTVFTYGDAWPADFPAPPLAADATAGDAEQMAAFSSRGPTDDGRIKPDVVAPGTWVLSSYSDLYQEFYDPSPNPVDGAFQYDGWGHPLDPYEKYFGGTSMATPIVAGSAAIVRDYYQKVHAHAASAALVKATLVNSAVDLLDENSDGVHDNDYPIPNNHEGWGRIDAAAATDGSAEWLDDAVGLQTNGSATSTHTVAGGADFKVTLAWSDYPASETAAVTLVNDLDLVVTAPDGTQYAGNQFSGGWSTTGGTADRVNNLENVYVPAAPAGTWTVTVSGFNVPFGPQPYALVVDGGGVPAPNTAPVVAVTAPPDGTTVSEGTTVTFTGTATDDEDGDLSAQIEWSSSIDGPLGTGASVPATLSVGTHTVTAGVTDSGGLSGSDSITVTVAPNTAPVVAVTAPPDGTTVSEGTAVTFTGTATDDEDGDLSAQIEWSSSIDGPLGTGASVTTATLSVGTHTVTAGVTDSGGLSGSDSITVTVEADPGASVMHIGDLDAASSRQGRRWTATVTVLVVDTLGDPVSGAMVSGEWSGGSTSSCTTAGDGTCTVVLSNQRRRTVTFTVTDVALVSFTYDAGLNSDPEGDSDGTSITVIRP